MLYDDVTIPFQAVIVFKAYQYTPLKFNDYEYPDWGVALWWIVCLIPILAIPAWVTYRRHAVGGQVGDDVILVTYDSYNACIVCHRANICSLPSTNSKQLCFSWFLLYYMESYSKRIFWIKPLLVLF